MNNPNQNGKKSVDAKGQLSLGK